jgi:hypothetical protein
MTDNDDEMSKFIGRRNNPRSPSSSYVSSSVESANNEMWKKVGSSVEMESFDQDDFE